MRRCHNTFSDRVLNRWYHSLARRVLKGSHWPLRAAKNSGVSASCHASKELIHLWNTRPPPPMLSVCDGRNGLHADESCFNSSPTQQNGQTCMATNARWLIHHGTRAKLRRKQTKVWVGIGRWECVHKHLPRIGEWQKWQEWQKKATLMLFISAQFIDAVLHKPHPLPLMSAHLCPPPL